MHDDSTLTPNQIVIGERLYAEAINLVLASTQHELLIFDQDLSHGDFASIQKYDLIQQFLSKSAGSRLTVILQHTGFFQQSCPRLLNLLTVYRHKMTIYETNQSAKHAKDCFVLADNRHYVKRIHIDQARFKYGLNDPENTGLLAARFKELLDATEDEVSITRTGL